MPREESFGRREIFLDVTDEKDEGEGEDEPRTFPLTNSFLGYAIESPPLEAFLG